MQPSDGWLLWSHSSFKLSKPFMSSCRDRPHRICHSIALMKLSRQELLHVLTCS